MFLFYVLSFFKKGDTIQGGTLFKRGHYLRKYGTLVDRKRPFKVHKFSESGFFCKLILGSTQLFSYMNPKNSTKTFFITLFYQSLILFSVSPRDSIELLSLLCLVSPQTSVNLS